MGGLARTPEILTHFERGENPWVCGECGGGWYETDTMGSQWLREKREGVLQIPGYTKFTCQTCEGETWTHHGFDWGVHETGGSRVFHAGESQIGEDHYWIYGGKNPNWTHTLLGYRALPIKTPLPPVPVPSFVIAPGPEEPSFQVQMVRLPMGGIEEFSPISEIVPRVRNEPPIFKTCVHCRGRWQSTSEEGYEWLSLKWDRLFSYHNWVFYRCECCSGGLWEGEARGQELLACLGAKMEGPAHNSKFWIYRGSENHWERSRPAPPNYRCRAGMPGDILPLDSKFWDKENWAIPQVIPEFHGTGVPWADLLPPTEPFLEKASPMDSPPQDWEVRSYTSSHSSFPSSAFSAVTWGGGEHAASSAASTKPMRSMPHSPALHHTHKPPLEMPTASEAAAIKPDNPVQSRPPMLVRKPKMAAKFLTRHSRSRSRRQGKALQENPPQLLESEAPPEPVRVREPLQVTHVTRRPPYPSSIGKSPLFQKLSRGPYRTSIFPMGHHPRLCRNLL